MRQSPMVTYSEGEPEPSLRDIPGSMLPLGESVLGRYTDQLAVGLGGFGFIWIGFHQSFQGHNPFSSFLSLGDMA